MYLLDTNICIYAMKNTYPNLTKRLFETDPAKIYLSSVMIAELEYGCAKSVWETRSRSVTSIFVSTYSVLPFEQEDAVLSGRLRAELAKAGKPIGPYDILIAAQGIARGLTVITHNMEEFRRVPGIQLEDWTK